MRSLYPTPESLLGREDELTSLRELYASGARLVTLVGVGGVGKTTLARAFAEDIAPLSLSLDSVLECDLTPCGAADSALEAVARKVDVVFAPADSVEERRAQIGRALGARGGVLLLLDNAEPVLDEVSACVATLLRSATELQILVTSREPLRIAAERVLRLEALSPEHAAALFRARAPKSSAPLDEARLLRVVRRLDHLPLAIEIAAAHTEVLSLAEIEDRVEAGVAALGSDRRDVPAHHRSMRAAIEWSIALLDPEETRALAWCSVFRGGFTSSAAEKLLAAQAPAPRRAPLELLRSLHRRSLLFQRAHPSADAPARFHLYEIVRELAREALEASGDRSIAERAHAELIVALGETWALELHSARFGEALRELDDASDDLLAASERMLELEPNPHFALAARAALALDAHASVQRPHSGRLALFETLYTRARGHTSADLEASIVAALLGALLDASLHDRARFDALAAPHLGGRASPGIEGRLWFVLARASSRSLDLGLARAQYQRSIDLFAEAAKTELAHEEADANARLGALLSSEGRAEESVACFARAERLFRVAGDPLGLALLAIHRGTAATLRLDFEESSRELRAAVARSEALGVKRFIVFSWILLGQCELARGNVEAARDLYRRVRNAELGMGARRMRPDAALGLGPALIACGELEEAEQVIEEALAFIEATGPRAQVGLGCLAVILALRGRDQPAAETYARARAVSPSTTAVVDVFALAGELAAAFRAIDAGDRAGALETTRRAREAGDAIDASLPIGGARPHTLTVSVAVLRAVATRAERQAAGAGPEQPALSSLRIEATGAWFAFDEGPTIDIAARKHHRRILASLLERRLEDPLRPLDVDELFAIGWPGDRSDRDSGLARVYMAIRKLRQLGLGEHLMRVAGGYVLDPRIRVERAEARTV